MILTILNYRRFFRFLEGDDPRKLSPLEGDEGKAGWVSLAVLCLLGPVAVIGLTLPRAV